MNRRQEERREAMRIAIVGAIAVLVIGGAFYALANLATAHPGGKDKIGCHTEKATGSLHWHPKGTSEPQGPCEDTPDGRVRVKIETEFVEVPAPNVAMNQQLVAAETEIQALQNSLAASQRAERMLGDSLETQMVRSSQANRDARAAEKRAMKAELRMATMQDEVAAARRGQQPCVPQRERLAARVDERWASGWRDDAMKLVECLRDG